MTDRSANIRVNVTGNAAAELGKVATAEKKVGDNARATAASVQAAGAKVDTLGKAAGASASKANALAGANARVVTSLAKTGAASISAANKFAATANAMRRVTDTNVRAVASLSANGRAFTEVGKAAEKAQGAVRQLSNSRVAPPAPALSMWQRIATAARDAAASAGRLGRTSVGGGVNGRALAGGVASLGAFGLDSARQAGSTLGIQGRDQLAASFVDTDVRIARLSAQARMSDAQTSALRGQINDASRQSLVSPAEVLSIVETGQNRFSNASGFAQAAPQIARFATATGANAGDVTGLVGEAFRQMNVAPEDVGQLLGAVQVTSEKGSVEASDIAGSMSPSIGAFAALTGQSGLAGMQNFLALAQTMGASGGDASVLTQNLLAKLSSGDVQRNLSQRGVEFRGANGQVDMQTMVTSLVNNRRFVSEDGQINQTALQGVLGADMQANTAMRTLLQEQIAGRGLSTIAGASSAEGTATIDLAMRRIQESAGGGVMKARVDAETNFLENGEALVRNMTSLASRTSDLETRFPRLSAGVDIARGAMSSFTATLGAMNLAGMTNVASGGAAGAAGGLSGAAGKLGTAAAAIAVASAAWEVSTRATLGLLDAGISSGALGSRLQREGGSASQDWTDFWSGNFSLGGGTANGGTAEEIRARVMAQPAARPAANAAPAAGVADPANTAATAENTAALDRNARATTQLAGALRSGPSGNPADAP